MLRRLAALRNSRSAVWTTQVDTSSDLFKENDSQLRAVTAELNSRIDRSRLFYSISFKKVFIFILKIRLKFKLF